MGIILVKPSWESHSGRCVKWLGEAPVEQVVNVARLAVIDGQLSVLRNVPSSEKLDATVPLKSKFAVWNRRVVEQVSARN